MPLSKLRFHYLLDSRWGRYGHVAIQLASRSENMIRRRNRRKEKSEVRAKTVAAAALVWTAAFFILLVTSGCITPPGPSDTAKLGTSAGPELPEAYETEVRGINRNLIQAAFTGRSDDVQRLFATEESKNLKEEYINTSLLLASVHGNTETVQVLLDNGADVNSTTVRGGTALMWAAGSSRNPSDTVRVLLRAGAEVNTRAENGRTALMDAAAIGNGEITEILLAAGAEVDGKDETGKTALMIAAVQGHLDCISILLEYGASTDAVDLFEQTALEKAKEANQTDVIDLLTREGAER